MSEFKYNYESANFVDLTSRGVSKDEVFELLFVSTVGGTPAVNFELSHIQQQVGELDTINVREVVAKEADKDNTLVFEVRTDSVSVTAPAGMPEDDLRVLHNEDIDYKYYRVAVLN